MIRCLTVTFNALAAGLQLGSQIVIQSNSMYAHLTTRLFDYVTSPGAAAGCKERSHKAKRAPLHFGRDARCVLFFTVEVTVKASLHYTST